MFRGRPNRIKPARETSDTLQLINEMLVHLLRMLLYCSRRFTVVFVYASPVRVRARESKCRSVRKLLLYLKAIGNLVREYERGFEVGCNFVDGR
jgi:hypothetical protein